MNEKDFNRANQYYAQNIGYGQNNKFINQNEQFSQSQNQMSQNFPEQKNPTNPRHFANYYNDSRFQMQNASMESYGHTLQYNSTSNFSQISRRGNRNSWQAPSNYQQDYVSDNNQSSNFYPGPSQLASYPLAAGYQYHEISNDNIDISKTQESHSAEESWIQLWLKKRIIEKKSNHGSTSIISIPTAKTLMRERVELTSKLETLHSTLRTDSSLSEEDWNAQFKSADDIMVKIDSINNQLNDGVIDQLKIKIGTLKKKRAHNRKRRKIIYEETLARREQLHAKIDERLDTIRQKVLDEVREKEVKKNADKVLAEVRKKTSASKQSLDLLKSLKKLRGLRREHAQKKGLFTLENDRKFDERMKYLIDLVQGQMTVYEDEQKALMVMLETEKHVEESKAKTKKDKSDIKKEKILNEKIKEMLFGKHDPPDESSLIYPFYQYHSSGQNRLDSLLEIRKEWDRYLVPEGTESASRMPVKWVKPVEPSSESWSEVLRK